MGKKNKVVKLTDRKIRYIIRAKKRGESTNRIAQDMKLSPSTVKRVWMHWMKTKMPLIIKKFGRKKKPLDEESTKRILEVSLIIACLHLWQNKCPHRGRSAAETMSLRAYKRYGRLRTSTPVKPLGEHRRFSTVFGPVIVTADAIVHNICVLHKSAEDRTEAISGRPRQSR